MSATIWNSVNQVITDTNGFKYSVQSDGLYKIYIPQTNKTYYFGFGIKGTLDVTNFKKTSIDYDWNYQKTDFADGYNVIASNTNTFQADN